MPDLSRRFFITGLISLVAAPAIVRAGSLMPVKTIDLAPAGTIMIQRLEWGGYSWWITGKDSIIHFEKSFVDCLNA